MCKGAVQSVVCRNDQAAGGEVVLVGGNDKSLTVFKFDGACTKLWNVSCDSKPLSLDLLNGNILIAQKNGSISEMKCDQKAKPNVVMTSHCDGEVWGMARFQNTVGRTRYRPRWRCRKQGRHDTHLIAGTVFLRADVSELWETRCLVCWVRGEVLEFCIDDLFFQVYKHSSRGIGFVRVSKHRLAHEMPI